MSLFPRSDIELRIADLPSLIGETGVDVSDETKLLLRASYVVRFANRLRKNQERRPIIISVLLVIVGGGVTKIFLLSEDPLEIVIGEAPRKPPLVPLARSMADLISSSRSVIEPLHLPRLGVMTRESPV